jgi:cell division protein FtsL
MSPQPAPSPRSNPAGRDRRDTGRSARATTAGGTALAVTPERRSAPRPAPARRPSLRVVDESRVRAVTRRKRTRALMIVAGVFTVVAIFALASFHAMLLSGQTQLDQLNREVAEERVTYEALRHQVAELESPGRIVTVAQDQLGMLPPEDVTWLVPTVTPEADPLVGRGEPEVAVDTGPGAGAPWAAVKPFLGGKR